MYVGVYKNVITIVRRNRNNAETDFAPRFFGGVEGAGVFSFSSSASVSRTLRIQELSNSANIPSILNTTHASDCISDPAYSASSSLLKDASASRLL